MEVVVLTNSEHGWDCVEGVFSDLTKALFYLNDKYNDPTENEFHDKSYWQDICWVFTAKSVV